jgi:hypothetical protein
MLAGSAAPEGRGVIMTRKIENTSHNDTDRIAILENRAAELERRLLAATQASFAQAAFNQAAANQAAFTPAGGFAGWTNAAVPGADPDAGLTGAFPGAQPPPGLVADAAGGYPGAEPSVGPVFGETGAYPAYFPPGHGPAFPPEHAGADDDGLQDSGRTEALINHGRQRARRRQGRNRGRGLLRHWRIFAVVAVALTAGIVAVLVTAGGPTPGWPASVAGVQAQIKAACANPDTAAEPSGLNFACGKDTQQVLWVFSLLTSGDNPRYADAATGRTGLEPITPAQGGDIAWSLNLHHPYNPASAADSLTVAARAINNIISGATLTSASGGAAVEPGLESTAANCQRYTGSPKLVSHAGYPASCAAALTSAGTQLLVSDAFQR